MISTRRRGPAVRATALAAADVDDVLSPRAFTIAGTLRTGADELLVLHKNEIVALDDDTAVAVTRTVQKRFDGEPYIQAEKVAFLPASG